MSSQRQSVNVLKHLQSRYIDQKIDFLQGKRVLTSKRGIVVEGSSICNQYAEWNEIITILSNTLSTLHTTALQWQECYRNLQQCVSELSSVVDCAIPEFIQNDISSEMAGNLFIETLDTLLIHANDRFQQIIAQASNLLERREKLVLEKETVKKNPSKDTAQINKMDTEFRRLKQEIERIDSEMGNLYSNARSLSSSYLKELSDTLQNAFSNLFPKSSISSGNSFLPVQSPLPDPAKPKFDFDSLLQSAFSTNVSAATSVIGESSQQTSLYDSTPCLSPRISFIEEDIPLLSETPLQDISETPRYPNSVTSLQDQLSVHSEILPKELKEQKELKELKELKDKDFSLQHEIQSHTLVLYSFSHSSSLINLLPHVNYDIISVKVTPAFLLLLTSRGSVMSYLWEPSECPLASGLSDAPLPQRLTPSLITSLQLERAIRNKRFSAIDCGETISVALASTGEVYIWGEGKKGELGLGEIEEASQPRLCLQLLHCCICKVACGSHHTLALDTNGCVYAWGCNEHGELGLGDLKNRNEPTLISFFKKQTIVDIAAGDGFSVCVDQLGRVYCFGWNEMGQCTGTSTPYVLQPTIVQDIRNEVVNVSCGKDHVMVLCTTGEVYAWGCGTHGEIGTSYTIAYATKPQLIPIASLLQEDEEVLFIQAGSHRCCIATTKCRLLTWGENDSSTPSFTNWIISQEGCLLDIALGSSCTVILQDIYHDYQSCVSLIQSTKSYSKNSNEKKQQSTDQIRTISHEWELQQRQLTRQWMVILEHPGMSFRSSHSMEALLEKGIPPLLRSQVWPLLIGNVLKITPEVYEIYKTRALGNHRSSIDSTDISEFGKETTVRLIDEDLKRTFVPLGFFSIGEPMYMKIHELLLIYAFYRPDIGYVQGMSFIAGILAVHIPDSYLCFQCLANLLGSEHLIAFYSLKPSFMKKYYEVFNSLFATINPSLYTYFTTNDIQSDLYLFKWLQSLFAQCFSLDITSRVLDNFLYEGTSYLFRTALSILKLLQPTIMKLPIEECFALLTGSIRMESIWKETVTMDSLFGMIQKIKFTEKQQQIIQDLVDNAFFYEDKEEISTKKDKRKTVTLSKDEVRKALSTVF